jgi:uncharacterized damage-inducible protein DinB
MPGPKVEQWLRMLTEAFDGDDEHSLLANLASVRDGDWRSVSPGGGRSIAEIAAHVAGAKYIYENRAFGDGRLQWEDPLLTLDRAAGELLEFVREGHKRLVRSIAKLREEDLETPRETHGGEQRAAWRIIAAMVEHDLYHAGEINHTCALLHGDDRWPWG